MIVYIGSFGLPFKDAVAKRALGIGYALDAAGYQVAFIGEDESIERKKISEDFYVDKFLCCSISKPYKSIEHYKYRKDLSLVLEKIDQWNCLYGIEAIIFCGTKCCFFAHGLVHGCKKRNIPVIADSMDWLTSQTGNILFDCIKNFDIWYEMQIVNRKVDAMIVISKYLKRYYEKYIDNIIVIPPLSPINCKKSSDTKVDDFIKLYYAGIPFRLGERLLNKNSAKDRLDLVLELVYSLSSENLKFTLDIYGMTVEQYKEAIPEHIEIIDILLKKNIVEFHGYVDANVAYEALLVSDYTILLREKNRTSEAGFPTKISESIQCGIPVITTDTSDILDYVEDGRDATILEINDFEIAKAKLKDILLSAKYGANNAKKYALQNKAFDPNSYTDILNSFIKKLLEVKDGKL